MNLRLFVYSAFTLLALASPLVYGDEPREQAYTETLLCADIAPEDAALFEHYFGAAAEPVAEGWDAEHLVQYASSWGKNKAGKRILCERLMILAEDGSSMRKLFCERFESNPARRVNFKEQKYCAIVPFVFAGNLVRIVDYQDETLYVNWVRFNPQTRQIEDIESKDWKRRDFGALKSDLTEEDKSLFDTYFPRHNRRRTPPTWDAERRVLYSARGRANSQGAYALNGTLKRIAEDGSSCRIATRTLEISGAWKSISRPMAYQLPMVKPFVFVENHSFDIIFHIEHFNPESGAYEGTRTKVYDFRSLQLVSDTWAPYPATPEEEAR
ncbi:MAG: hypothetical protein IKW48_08985 [Akkermansia sp.]|nr:hypothetical protein [Akkermansia sp.]